MNQKQSEDFDSTVRKLAEEAERAYQAHSWTLMEKLLDQKKNKRRLAVWFWPTAALILGVLLWFTIMNFPSTANSKSGNPSQAEILQNKSLDHSYLYALKATVDVAFDHVQLPASDVLKPMDEAAFASNNILKSNADQANHQSNIISNNTRIKSAGDKYYHLKGAVQDLNVSHVNNAPDQVINLNLPLSSPSSNKTESLSNTSIEANTAKSSLVIDERSFDLTVLPQRNPNLEFPGMIHLNFETKPDEIKSPKRTTAALIFNAGWSPEYTAVLKRSAGKLGNTYGFNIGFRFSRWTFSTGLQKSSKDYNAMKEDYEIEENSYYKNLTFINIKGNCNVMQWPFSVGYDLISSKFFTLQLNTSVSSLRMDDEQYIYDYYHSNWKLGHDIHSYAFKNWHWLAAASAGLSIQKSISKHLAVSINPYYQLPLKGIGEGKVHLKSFGSQIGINWSINTGQ